MKRVYTFFFGVWIACTLASQLSAATFSFIYSDPPGFGYNDTTPVSPIGVNTGTTLGQQRRFLLEFAANKWADYLVSEVEIVIEADFEQLGGSPFSATLAFAGPSALFTVNNAPIANTLYAAALADSLSGLNQDISSPDIVVTVNESVDSNPDILGGGGFYYGVDNETPNSQADLLSTLLHEIGHGLGFLSTVDLDTGAFINGAPDSFTRLIYDEETDQFWTEMSDNQRVASATNDPDLVFTGPATQQAAKRQLKTSGVSVSLVDSQDTVLETFPSIAADFGLALPPWGIQGELVLVDDGIGTTSDGCETPFINADEVRGRVALIDRGNCNFDIKVKNAQNAGALAVIIANNQANGVFTMIGNDESINIPAAFVSIESGTTLRNALPGALVNLQNIGSLTGRQNGKVRLHAPASISPGSSVSHWAIDTAPDLLMEPNISGARLPNLDLSLTALRDIGWAMRNVELPFFDYALWAEEQITNALDATTEDADGDLATNLEEYAAATDPMDAASLPASLSLNASPTLPNTFELDYIRNALAGDLIFGVQTANDLNISFVNAISGFDYVLYNTINIADGIEQAELNISNSDIRGFYRITSDIFTPAPAP